MQQVRNRASFGDGLVEELVDLGEKIVVGIFFLQFEKVHLGHGQELAEAIVQFARKLAALFILKLEYAATEAAGAVFHALALGEFAFEQTEVNPEEQNRKYQHS